MLRRRDYADVVVCSFPGSSRRELVDATVVVIAAVNRGTIEVSKRIDNHAVIGKTAIGRTLESVNYSFGPLTATGGTYFKDCATA